MSGMEQFQGLGLVVLNLDRVTKNPQIIEGQGGNKGFRN